MIYVEMMSPHGHIRLNNFYLAELWSAGDLLVIGQGLAPEYKTFKVKEIPDFLKGKLNRFWLAITLLRAIPDVADRRICFLSYDLMMMPLISAYLRFKKWEIFVFEHNTAPTNFMKRIFQRCIGRSTIHFVYADYIAQLFAKLNLRAYVISCPILTTDMKGNAIGEVSHIKIIAKAYSEMVFCPSGSAELTDIERIAAHNPDRLFVVKTKTHTTVKNIFSASSFTDYLGVMRLADFVYIPFPREDKISGPFFEAIGCGKKIVVKRNKFGAYAKQFFPGNVLFEDEDWKNPTNGEAYDAAGYNMKVIRDLNAMLRREQGFLGSGASA